MASIGIISDTHGLLRSEALEALQGCDHVIHAGDIGDPDILTVLKTIAPLTAIRGNVDDWATDLPDTIHITIAGKNFFILHDLKTLDTHLRSSCDIVVAGHSHKPLISTTEDGKTIINPGSAGRRRFNLPVTVARLSICGTKTDAKIVHLLPPNPG